ncbi:MAG: M15 family metallopeptidase [Burkholderiaceae bacterium]
MSTGPRKIVDTRGGLHYNMGMRTFVIFFFASAFLALSGSSVHAATVGKISDALCAQMKAHGVVKENSPVPCRRLRIVQFTYLGFDGKTRQDGEIMVMDAVAEHVRSIFEELLRHRFPIARARLVHHYGGDDAASMRDNNTSAFNHRDLTGGGALSLHAYGLAIDINPIQNPYIAFESAGKARISPEKGMHFVNRQKTRPGKPERSGMAEDVVQIFARHGFASWGGDWDNPIDYQHFQVGRALAEQLAALPAEKAREAFERHVQRYRDCLRAGGSIDRSRPHETACRHSN